MDKTQSEFIIYDDMVDEEFEYLKEQAINNCIKIHIDEIKKKDKYENIFKKQIAFTLKEERYLNRMINEMTEKIILEPIYIQTIEKTIKMPRYNPKFTLKQRIKILFKGNL